MTDKELKRLGRAELIDIIFELQKRCEEYTATIDKLKEAQADKELRIAKAGSIAEAALQVNGIFEAAQAAADQYVHSIHAASRNAETKVADTEKQCSAMLQSAHEKAGEIIASAEKKAQQIQSDADKQVRAEWQQFQQKANELIRAHEELSSFMQKDL